jgi:hypothetical protein
MGSLVVVVVGPGLEFQVSLVGVGPVLGVGPLSESGLDKPLGFSVGSGSVRSGAVMFDVHTRASFAKLCRPVAGAVVGEQGANGDAVGSEELYRRVQEVDGGFGLLVGQHLSEGQAGVVINGHMKCQKTGMLQLTAQAAIATATDLREARHAFDIEMQQIAGYGMLVALHGEAAGPSRASGSAGRDAECG